MMLPHDPSLIAFLKALFDTNADFASAHNAEFFAKFHDAQTPNLTILKCSDSRVQMESFDKTPQNGIFAIRNIGNQISTCEGSIDFGIEILNTRFFLVIGHSDCGAVTAALKGTKTESKFINEELGTIKITETCLEAAIVENVNNQVLRALEKYKARIDDGRLTVLGAIYDFKNDFGFGHGRVVLTNVNGITDAALIKKTYSREIDNINFLGQ